MYFPDPYARVVFVNQSQVTRCIHRTLCPTWDQTLVFDEVYIYGSTEHLQLNSPQIVLELFDKDEVVCITKAPNVVCVARLAKGIGRGTGVGGYSQWNIQF